MAIIRPLFVSIPRITFELPSGWRRNFLDLQIANRLTEEDLRHCENWLRCYVEKLHIASFSADQKLVQRALESLEKQSAKLLKSASDRVPGKYAGSLLYLSDPKDENQRATNIALDYVGNGLLVDRDDFDQRDLADRGRRARVCLVEASTDHNSASRVRRHAALALELLKRTPDQNEQHFAQLIGQSRPDGTPFDYRADPQMQAHFRVEQDARNVLAAALCVIYWRAISKPYVPKDGREPNPFMQFLNAARASLPRPQPTSLHSAARTLLQRVNKSDSTSPLDDLLKREAGAN